MLSTSVPAVGSKRVSKTHACRWGKDTQHCGRCAVSASGPHRTWSSLTVNLRHTAYAYICVHVKAYTYVGAEAAFQVLSLATAVSTRRSAWAPRPHFDDLAQR